MPSTATYLEEPWPCADAIDITPARTHARTRTRYYKDGRSEKVKGRYYIDSQCQISDIEHPDRPHVRCFATQGQETGCAKKCTHVGKYTQPTAIVPNRYAC